MILTLNMLHTESHILLGKKKRGFGAGKWNGYGGKLEANETIEESAIREVFEESNITVTKLDKRGILYFSYIETKELLEVHVFTITEHTGTPIETPEMKPAWFPLNDIPYHEMWENDPYWIPQFLAGECFVGSFLFNEKTKLIGKEISIVSKL